MSSMPYPLRSDDAAPVYEFPVDEVVLDVDTHRDGHVAAVLTLAGAVAGSRAVPATVVGYARMVSWAARFGRLHRAGVEGASSYGAALARHLTTAGIQVIEVNQPDRAERRRRGKTDAIDAKAAARAVLTGRATALAKDQRRAGGDAADAQNGQELRGQVPHPGDQPAQPRGDLATVELFRVDDGVIVEHWDVVQSVPDEVLHPHGMF